jgi:hypothetical protein
LANRSRTNKRNQKRKQLADLNELQKQFDRKVKEIDYRKTQLYLYWTASLKPNTDYQANLRRYLSEQIQLLKSLKNEIDTDKTDIENSRTSINDGLKDLKSNNPKEAFVLKSYSAPRYYVPTEPVLLFQGALINSPNRYGGDGNYTPDNTLVCRINPQLISHLIYNNTKITTSVQLSKLPNFSDFEAILREALLTNADWLVAKNIGFDTSNVRRLMSEFILPSDVVVPKSDTDQPNLTALLNQSTLAKQTSYNTTSQANQIINTVTFFGTAPSPVAINFWNGNPWLPLYFSYDVSYFPVASKTELNNAYNIKFINEKFTLNHHNDKLTPVNNYHYLTDGIRFQNTSLLSRHSKTNIQEKIKEYIEKHPEQEDMDGILSQLYTISAKLPDLLSQSLFGFNEALTGLKNTLQLAIVNFDENNTLQTLASDLNDIIDGHNKYEIDNNAYKQANYLPLSGGLLKINELKIIDAFGRHIDVPKNNLAVAGSLTVTDKDITNLYIAPRITHPTRLNAQWTPSESTKPSPIAGWLMPNFIDQSIWLFSNKGEALGELLSMVKKWKKVPGSAWDSFETAIENLPITFQKVATYFYNDAKNVSTFLNETKLLLSTNQPDNHRSLSANALFLGTPLAVADLELSLELEGLPPIDYSEASIHEELKEAITDNASSDVFNEKNKFKRCQGLSDVKVPVLIGNTDHVGDGLMAYLINDTQKDYSKCYYANEEQALQLNGQKLKLTLVFDPRNNIHFHTGLLPVKQLQLAPEHYGSAIQNMQLAISVGSVLVASGYSAQNKQAIKMPLPATAKAQWEWWWGKNDEWKNTKATEEHDDAVNEGFNELTQGWLKITNT